MIDVCALRLLATAIGTRREIHLDCLTRQIAARAGRQATTVSRRSDVRLNRHKFIDSLTFERWSERDMIACRLAAQEQVIDELQRSGDPPVRPRAR
ncbi:hypothetical protein OCK02_24560 [Rhizobium sp. TRM96647]|uniref:hypothetical protein n=1 Tax=unclassified Rhizobium TaxID=2613769 RepID=UPI0021E759FA|nr:MULTISPECIES: hypothetical protein [unclassified Rhizobium]MCV3739341.1 hypothetical protein [Rhizobium sp. TRM96647]MCV3761007.1 hypothetical protein [Rhizobium sp. TRM96650]